MPDERMKYDGITRCEVWTNVLVGIDVDDIARRAWLRVARVQIDGRTNA